ncbi:MAG: glutamyl-tRNA reductase [Armatimonadetes bacterium]|nr:glutamyl-tRNA reductase [Armatimonadota bacterium]
MPLVLVGLNHKTAPIEVREKVAFGPEGMPELVETLKQQEAVRECAILSTCNRTEMYAATEDTERCSDSLAGFLAVARPVGRSDYAGHLYHHDDENAIRHLFRVSSGLDSMIVGENQILGQVKKAYSVAQGARTTGPLLDKLFPWALRVGKRARSQTRIAQGASSVASAAVELAQKIFGDLKGRRLLLLGAGKMSEKALKLLVDAGVERVTVANRTFQRAADLANLCGGEAVPFEHLDRALGEVDVMISSTGAPHYVVGRERLTEVMKTRRGKPLFLVDIAVPRDIEPSCEEIDNVYLYNIDDLQEAVNQNLVRRHKEVTRVLEIVDSATQEFLRYLDSRKAGGVIRSLRTSFDDIRERELERFLERNDLSADQRQLLERFSQGLINKLLHHPSVRLRQLGSAGIEPEELARSLEVLGLAELPKPEEEEEDTE